MRTENEILGEQLKTWGVSRPLPKCGMVITVGHDACGDTVEMTIVETDGVLSFGPIKPN